MWAKRKAGCASKAPQDGAWLVGLAASARPGMPPRIRTSRFSETSEVCTQAPLMLRVLLRRRAPWQACRPARASPRAATSPRVVSCGARLSPSRMARTARALPTNNPWSRSARQEMWPCPSLHCSYVGWAVAGMPSGIAAPHEHDTPQDLKSSSAGDEYLRALAQTVDLSPATRGDDCRSLGVQAAVSKRAWRCTQTTQALQLPAVAHVGAHSPADEGTEEEEDAPMFLSVFRRAVLQSDLTGDQLRRLAKRLGLVPSPGQTQAP